MGRKRGDSEGSDHRGSDPSSVRQPPAPAKIAETKYETADYIASMLEGLRGSAHQADLPFLAYLLSMALEEARSLKVKNKRAP